MPPSTAATVNQFPNPKVSDVEKEGDREEGQGDHLFFLIRMNQSYFLSLPRFISASPLLSFSFLAPFQAFILALFHLTPPHFGSPPRDLNGTDKSCHFKMSSPWNKDPLTIVFLHFTTSPPFSHIHECVSVCVFLKFPYLHPPKAGTHLLRSYCRSTGTALPLLSGIGSLHHQHKGEHPRFAFWNSSGIREESNIINDGHKADECHHLSPVLTSVIEPPLSLWGFLFTGQWVQSSVVWFRPMRLHWYLSSLSSSWSLALCSLKEALYHLLKDSPSFSLSPWTHIKASSPSQKPTELFCSAWKLLDPPSTKTPSGSGFSKRSPLCL